MIELQKVREEDYRFLYDLMAERTADINISHRNLPTWDQHVKFCRSSPYLWRWIIWDGPIRVGTCYVTMQREIGLFISEIFQGNGNAKQALQLILQQVKGPVYANINPRNLKSIMFFRRQGFRKIQETYKLE